MAIPKFTKGPRKAKNRVNQLIDWANRTKGSLGLGGLNNTNTAGGVVQTVSINQIRPQISKTYRQTGIGVNRRARTTAAAGAATTIVCNLYDQNGVEQLTGDESGITVYCFVSDGSANLNAAVPRLRDNEDVIVTLLPFSPSENRWYMVFAGFQPSEDCS